MEIGFCAAGNEAIKETWDEKYVDVALVLLNVKLTECNKSDILCVEETKIV